MAGLAARAAASRAGDMLMRRISSISTSTVADSEAALKTLVSSTEYGDSRRSNTYSVRLHPAKYLKCDPLMKELFFPIMNMCRNFGFVSGTGIGALTAPLIAEGGLTPNFDTAFAKSNGCWRGFSMFTIRSDALSPTNSFKLNAVSADVGVSNQSGTSHTIKSCYRRFNNGPAYQIQTNSGSAPGRTKSAAQQFVLAAASGAGFNNTQASMSECGNLSDIETCAVQSTNFQHSVGSSTGATGTTDTEVTAGTPGGVNWDGTGSVYDTNTGYYYPNLRNTTIRIADGFLEMDVTNGKNSSVILELVINSQTKQESDFSPQKFFDQVYQSVEYQQLQERVNGPGQLASPTEASPGGWQAFYDPEYPFLGIKSAHSKKARSMYREVHRSSHALGPGQSKTLKVALGSHFYSLGSKTLNPDGISGANRMRPEHATYPLGSLLIGLAHSGVSQLTMPTITNGAGNDAFSFSPDTFNASTGVHTAPGAGFWAGKQRAPSEIIVKGSYKEKYYPAYVISEQRNNYDNYVMMPPSVDYKLLGAGLPVQETIGVVDASKKAVAAKIATSVRDEL